MTEREKLLKQLSALQFASWELHLYMDTHPYDKDAMEESNRITDLKLAKEEGLDEGEKKGERKGKLKHLIEIAKEMLKKEYPLMIYLK